MNQDDFERALHAARRLAESRFRGRELARWLEDAIDIAHDAVLAASKKHDPSRGPFAPFARSWVDRALRSLLSNRSKRAGRRATQFQLTFDFAADGTATLSASGCGIPEDLIGRLTELQREAVTRRYGKSETYAEIGRSRGVSRQAAHRVNKRAIEQIRKKISGADG